MIDRSIENSVLAVVSKIPILVITGPRQSGKTTLAKKLFPDYEYFNLEFPDNYELAKNDSRSFLKNIEKGIILDEIQRLPSILSYIQVFTDEKKLNGKVILTGSQNLHLMQAVTQSLAGRTVNFTLLPFSMDELSSLKLNFSSNEYIFNGFYPRIYDQNISPAQWLPSYIQSYIERDLRQIINIKDLDKFQLFIRIIAARVGQLINYQSISSEIGVDAKTIRSWLSILETSYIIFHLKPYYYNFNKRLIKASKIYFYDTGLACSLLGIKDIQQINTHYLRGNLFENLIIAEIKKKFFNYAVPESMYFWRDSSGNEIDLILENANKLQIIEIKSSSTIHTDFLKQIKLFKKLAGNRVTQSYIVYGGNENIINDDCKFISWSNCKELSVY
jgi:predicted AAA+ superfamily ATPase